jgi:mevalonate kinase
MKTFKEFVNEMQNASEESLKEAKPMYQISKEELHKIWGLKDLEEKRKAALELLDKLTLPGKSLNKIKEEISKTKDGNMIDKAVVNLVHVQDGNKVI